MSDKLNNLRKSNSDRMIAGVCGGFAEATNSPSWLWRVGFVIWGFCGMGLIAYLVLLIFMPAAGGVQERY